MLACTLATGVLCTHRQRVERLVLPAWTQTFTGAPSFVPLDLTESAGAVDYSVIRQSDCFVGDDKQFQLIGQRIAGLVLRTGN